METPDAGSVPLLLDADARLIERRLTADESLMRVRPGVYAPSAVVRALPPWDRYVVRVRAFALDHPDAVFSHESAAALLGLPVFGEPRSIHIFDTGRSRSKRLGDVCLHTSVDARDVIRRDGVLMTSPAHTALDLARTLPPAFALAVVDAALRAEDIGSVDRLSDLASRQSCSRGLRRLTLVLSLADARAESPAESVSRALIDWLGFDAPELQVTFPHGAGSDRVDFFWRDARVIGEADGNLKYAASDAGAIVVAEKRREDRLRAMSSGFIRWGWDDCLRITPLETLLSRAGIARPRRPLTSLLATVRRLTQR